MPRFALATLLALLTGCAATAGAPPAGGVTAGAAAIPADLGARLLREYIQPRTRALQTSATQTQTAVQGYCARPADAARRALVERRLGELAEAWAHVELLRFGPLTEANRLEHFFFWPDPRAVMQRQLRALLAAADPALLAPDQLQQQSAAVQGLPALEYALYADDAAQSIAGGEAGRYRCAWAAAVATNLARLAREIAAGWNGNAPSARELSRPAADNSIYRSRDEVATEMLKALSTGLHVLRDQKLVPALGASADQARGALLPLWRSALTTRYLAAGVDALAAFYAAGGLDAALPESDRWIDDSVRGELRRLRADFDQLDLPMSQALADATQRDLLIHAQLLLTNARSIVDENLAPALAVNLGFNSLDGD